MRRTTLEESVPFEASRIKIRRAEKHIAELEASVSAFLSRKPFRTLVEADSPGRQCVKFKVQRQVPKELSTILGDVIHNLRTALDLLVAEIVPNGQSDEDVQFPFCRKAEDLEAVIKRRHIDRAAPEYVELIRGLKPYNDGNVELRAIHDLDIRDKHRMLIPVGSAANFGDAEFGGRAKIKVGSGVSFGVIDDFVLFRFPADPRLKAGQGIKTTFTLGFAPLDPLGGRELLSTLRRLAKLVSGIVDDFERTARHQEPRVVGGKRS